MKHIYTLINTAFLLLTISSAVALENDIFLPPPLVESSGEVILADLEFIGLIEKEIHNPLTPFDGEFKGGMKLTSIQRDGVNISLNLTSPETFSRGSKPATDIIFGADLLSTRYFYLLPFLYGNNGNVCRDEKFYPTQAVIKINYDFPNIGYKTQVTRPVSEICGWTNRDQSRSQDASFNVTTQRNLFSSIIDLISRTVPTMFPAMSSQSLEISLDKETLIYNFRDLKPTGPMSEKAIINTLFPIGMCRLFRPFDLLNIKLRFQVLMGDEKVARVIEKDVKQLCGF